MAKKPNLVLITTLPITKVPRESFDEYKRWVLVDGLKPSIALRKFMDTYNCPKPDTSIPITLVEYTFPDIDIARLGFRFRINDSAYPNSDPKQFSDEDFDKGIEELLALSPWPV
ncbi:MAG: hypothetical protein HY080_12985 [Gammaproteobacteria bacterium]|nr:hypothetical protein [Gammaproteobacteria bacterium]